MSGEYKEEESTALRDPSNGYADGWRVSGTLEDYGGEGWTQEMRDRMNYKAGEWAEKARARQVFWTQLNRKSGEENAK